MRNALLLVLSLLCATAFAERDNTWNAAVTALMDAQDAADEMTYLDKIGKSSGPEYIAAKKRSNESFTKYGKFVGNVDMPDESVPLENYTKAQLFEKTVVLSSRTTRATYLNFACDTPNLKKPWYDCSQVARAARQKISDTESVPLYKGVTILDKMGTGAAKPAVAAVTPALPTTAQVEAKPAKKLRDAANLDDLRGQSTTLSPISSLNYDAFDRVHKSTSARTNACDLEISGLTGFDDYQYMYTSTDSTTWKIGDYVAADPISAGNPNDPDAAPSDSSLSLANLQCQSLPQQFRGDCANKVKLGGSYATPGFVPLTSTVNGSTKTIKVYAKDLQANRKATFDCLASNQFTLPQIADAPASTSTQSASAASAPQTGTADR